MELILATINNDDDAVGVAASLTEEDFTITKPIHYRRFLAGR